MENLHLKNLNNIPTGYIILKKLRNEIEKNYYIESHKPRDEITSYIKSLNFKNEQIKEYINDFLIMLKEDPFTLKMEHRLDQIIRIITLLCKYKINEVDVGDKINFTEINNHRIKLNNLQSIDLIYDNGINKNSIIFSYTLILYPNTKISRYITDIIYITGSNNTITNIHKGRA